MGDAAQWVRGLVGRRSDRTAAGRERLRAGAHITPPGPSAAVSRDASGIETPRWRANWRLAPILAAGGAVLGILAIYWPTAASIVAIWIRSETFTHGFVVVPICLWLVWRNRETFAAIPAQPWWPGLAVVLAAGALWFVTSVADVLGIKQFALAFMLQAAIVTVLGTRIARAAFFPLAFLLFTVPFGEIFVPTLIEWTADFTVAALRWSGVPVYREANMFIIPSGAWSVVEACSGIRYIISSVMVGTIYGAVTYHSIRRRVAFIAISILVPIVANWLRAYMIVMIGHLSDNRLATGIDHVIYGWVFFGLVMLLMFWLGSFWREGEPLTHGIAAPPGAEAGALGARPFTLLAAAISAVVVAGLWTPVGSAISRSTKTDVPQLRPLSGEGGWAPATNAFTTWKPHYLGYASELNQTFQKDNRSVGLYLALFRNQKKGRELVTSSNVLVTQIDWKWKQLSNGSSNVDWAGASTRVYRTEIAGMDTRLEVYRLYWVNGTITASEYIAKALIAWSKLRGRGDDSALIVIYTEKPALGVDVSETLRDFASKMSPSIEHSLATAQGVPM